MIIFPVFLSFRTTTASVVFGLANLARRFALELSSLVFQLAIVAFHHFESSLFSLVFCSVCLSLEIAKLGSVRHSMHDDRHVLQSIPLVHYDLFNGVESLRQSREADSRHAQAAATCCALDFVHH